ERGPEAAVCVAVTEQPDLFRSRIRHAEWLEQEDQFVESLAVNEGGEKSVASGVVEIVESAQLAIVAQAFAQQFLIVAIESACLTGCWAPSLHRRIRRRFDLFESFISEAQHQLGERFRDSVFAGEDLETALLYVGGWHQRQLAIADEDRCRHPAFDWRDEIQLARLQVEVCGVALELEIVDDGITAREI